MKTLVILPTYNEAKNINSIVKKIVLLKVSYLNILIVDDNSPDGTGKIADELADKYSGIVYVMHRTQKNGLGMAYSAGFSWAVANKYGVVCEMDADGSHDPRYLPKMLNGVNEGADLVIGSRRVAGGKIVGWGWHRHLMSWGATTLSRFVLKIPTKDITAGFRAYSAKAIKCILNSTVKSSGYAFQEETLWLVYKNKMIIKEIPITFIDRKLGKSKLSSKDSKEFFKTLYRLAKS
jgi:dolichol-phosphate mannosyltransferase